MFYKIIYTLKGGNTVPQKDFDNEQNYNQKIATKDQLQRLVDNYLENPEKINLDYFKNLDLSLLDDLDHLFSVIRNPKANTFNLDISGWNTQNIKSANFMFYGAEQFNQDLSRWDLKNLEIANFMFYGTQLNQSINDWDLSKLKFAYQMFKNDFINSNKDQIILKASNLETKNIILYESLHQNIMIKDDTIFDNEKYFNLIANTVDRQKITFIYDDIPNFKSFWANIFSIPLDIVESPLTINSGIEILGDMKNLNYSIDLADIGGIVTNFLYGDFIKYSFFQYDIEEIKRNIDNYIDEFRDICDNNSSENIQINRDIINEIKNKNTEEKNIYNYTCDMFEKILNISTSILPPIPTNPSDDFIYKFFSDTYSSADLPIDIDKKELLNLIVEIYNYRTFLNNKSNFNTFDFANQKKNKINNIHINFFEIFKEHLTTKKLKDFNELKKLSKLQPFIFKSFDKKNNRLLLNKDIISKESIDYFKKIYKSNIANQDTRRVLKNPSQERDELLPQLSHASPDIQNAFAKMFPDLFPDIKPSENQLSDDEDIDLISIIYKKAGLIFASYLTHKIRYIGGHEYLKNNIKFTKIFLLFLFKSIEEIEIDELLDAIFEVSDFNISIYEDNISNPIKTFFSTFNDDYEIFLNEHRKKKEDNGEDTKSSSNVLEDSQYSRLNVLEDSKKNKRDYEFSAKGDEETFNKFTDDLFQNKKEAKFFCIYNFILDKTYDLLPYWEDFKNTVNNKITISDSFNFRKMIMHYRPEIREEKQKFFNLLNNYQHNFDGKRLKAFNFFKQIIKQSDINSIANYDNYDENINLLKFFRFAFGIDYSPEKVYFTFTDDELFKVHLCAKQIEIPLNGWEIIPSGPTPTINNDNQEFINFRNLLKFSMEFGT